MNTKLFLLVTFYVIGFTSFAQTNTTEFTFNFEKKGNGSPVVIFESGLGETLQGWKTVQDSISKTTTTLSYDRIGLGKSSTTEKPRTLENLVTELNSFIEKEKIEGPFILVGHSLGGFIIRKFQNTYPEKVLGLIMVDPSHELLFETIFASKPKEQAEMMRNGMNGFYANRPIAIQNEFKELSNAEKEMKSIILPTNIPITILASYQTPPPPFAPEDIKIKKELFNNWIEDAPQTKLISTVKSGHYIHYSEPIIVIESIKAMIEEVNKK
jgi:pimeloyl-ACP methyl ester carboxylesterase